MIAQLPDSRIDQLFADATTIPPAIVASQLQDLVLPGWDVVPGGLVAASYFHDQVTTVFL
jgi:hypothetical protein